MSALLAGARRDAAAMSLSVVYLLLGFSIIELALGAWIWYFVISLVGLVSMTALFAAGMRGTYHVLVNHADRPITAIIRDIRGISLATAAFYLPVAGAQVILTSVFWQWKTHLPEFAWDQTLSSIDRTLHFGLLPWQWLQPLLGYWPVTFLLSINYGIWFMVMWMFWMAVAFSERPQRTQFLVTFALLWIILGSFMATAFASAGPCFFGNLGLEESPYAELMSYLKAADQNAPIFALNVQDMLWQGHTGAGSEMGISAMPSLHNATALLMVLASRGFHSAIRWALKIHFVLIFLGSIHLGWHYAVDAYVSFAATLLIWFGIASRYQSRTPIPQF
ncbi:phosphatase PAP2 family protein [Ensifer sp. 1H6]|uniref:phosphatase PAP2 family protein n=1 Tax=Ensifer sp. 1H6 TaxID=1911585 RepID=UPI0009C92F33|nr:phosphatase PAP2 family protein [Ensifer sp. 1H6]OMQ46731.1 hypothetical protein BKP54_02580 [Ensifer sp. 1H6]